MNSEKFERLQDSSAQQLAEKFKAMKEHAEHIVNQRIEAMKSTGEAYELSEDEERMIRAYRSFVTRMRPGAIFSWETPRRNLGIVTPADVSIIRDPQDVSV